MNQFMANSATVGVVLSLTAYYFGMFLKKKTGLVLFQPLLVAIVLVIAYLAAFSVDYESYQNSGKYLGYLLTPATVCLAIPLYKQFELLKKNLSAVFVALAAGALASMGSVLALCAVFGLPHEVYVTLLPKSVTTAIGMGVAEELGGYPAIAAAVIIITGVFGNMTAEFICKTFRIRNAISRGLGIGAASHAIGTTKAMEMGEAEGAMSSLAIVISGLFTVIGASIFAGMY